MESLLSRYLAGAYEQVWDELVSMGEDVRQEPGYTQARAVAQETARRVRSNCERLIPRMEQWGWQFFDRHSEQRDPASPWQKVARLHAPASPVVLDEIERRAGPLPLVLRVFYEVVGGINFIGTPFKRPGWPRSEELDPLFIAPVELAVSESARATPDESHDSMGHSLFVAPDFLMKYGIAGVGSLFIPTPSLAIDAPLIFEGQVLTTEDGQPLTLVRYLRLALRGGGFLVQLASSGAQIPPDDLDFLTADLLPF